jgi:hypothetical protein
MNTKIAGALGLILLLTLPALTSLADEPPFEDELLDRFVGQWVLQGFLAGGEKVHDIDAAWVLGHQYLRFHDVSRELTPDGSLEYDATVYIGWDKPSGRYVCLWLDSTGGGGLNGEGLGYAVPNGDALEFKFQMGKGSVFHTTFAYDREADLWRWSMDSERDGQLNPFARVTMSRCD